MPAGLEGRFMGSFFFFFNLNKDMPHAVAMPVARLISDNISNSIFR